MSLKDALGNPDEGDGRVQSAGAGANALPGGPGPTQTLMKLDCFKIYRGYRLAEQNLLNHRLTWNLAIQGFLFATYGFCLQKLAELEAGENNAKIALAGHTVAQIRCLLKAIPWAGLGLSLCILAAVLGAWLVLRKLKRQWDNEVENHITPCSYLPNPAGAGSMWGRCLGYVPPFLIPLGFALAWVYIIVRR